MGYFIRYDTTRIRGDADQIEGCIAEMRNQEVILREAVARLDAMWDGESSDAFKAEVHDDLDVLVTIIDALEGIRKFELKSERRFESCNRQVRGLVDQIR